MRDRTCTPTPGHPTPCSMGVTNCVKLHANWREQHTVYTYFVLWLSSLTQTADGNDRYWYDTSRNPPAHRVYISLLFLWVCMTHVLLWVMHVSVKGTRRLAMVGAGCCAHQKRLIEFRCMPCVVVLSPHSVIYRASCAVLPISSSAGERHQLIERVCRPSSSRVWCLLPTHYDTTVVLRSRSRKRHKKNSLYI